MIPALAIGFGDLRKRKDEQEKFAQAHTAKLDVDIYDLLKFHFRMMTSQVFFSLIEGHLFFFFSLFSLIILGNRSTYQYITTDSLLRNNCET